MGSESSFGDSHASSDGLKLPQNNKEKQFLQDDDDEEEMEDSSPQTLTTGLFGVIYTVSRERTVTWRFVSCKVFLDAWQLLMLIVNSQYGWHIDRNATWWKVVSIIQLTDFMTARGFSFFLACLYTFVILLLITICMCIWVAWSFKNKRFDQVWPITFLRWFGCLFFQLLDVASMSFFMITLDCQYFDVDPSVQYNNQEFPDQSCWAMPYMIHVMVAAGSLVAFVVLTALFQMGEMELNMTSKNPLAMAHSKVEVQTFLLKFLMTAASTFLNNLKWLSTFYVVCMMLMVYIAVQWVPYYHSYMNITRSAVYAAVLYSAAIMMLLVYRPGVDQGNADAVLSWQTGCTIAMIAGLVPMGALGALASHYRLKHALERVVRKFTDAPPGTKSHFIHQFSHPLEVEISARCCRKWADLDTLDEDAVEAAGIILKAGMTQLPNSAYMTILYASFLIDVQGSFQSGLVELRNAKKADPSFLERFAIFSREQQNTQRASGAKGAQGADLVSYVEQQRDYRLAIKVHKEALRATNVFWRSLVHPVVKLETLSTAVGAFDEAVKQAEQTYRSVIQRNSDNWKLIRMYAAFTEHIKNDPWTAAKWRELADELFQAEDDEKHNLVLDIDDTSPGNRHHKVVKAAMDDANRGVIIINAHCLITAVSKTTCDLLGYPKKQIVNRNVNILIPQPFAKAHDNYVANHIKTGVANMLDKTSHLALVHREQHLIPIAMHVAKLSGAGMDSMFVAVIEPIPCPPDTACMWVLGNGTILSVDATFSDWFGHQARDLIANATSMPSLVADPKALAQAFREARIKESAQEHQTSDLGDVVANNALVSLALGGESDSDLAARRTVVKDLMIKHKFAGAIRCDVTINNAGGSAQRHFFFITIARPAFQRPMIVSDRKGKVIHVAQDVAEMLGYPVQTLMGEMAATAWDVLLPEPFCQLHRALVTDHTAGLPPPYSCRSGLSMCLMIKTNEGPEVQPFKLTIEPHRFEGGDSCNITVLEKRSMEAALDERRLSVMLDETGVVVSVSRSPEALFGFKPEQMIGRSIADFVDVFKQGGSCDAESGVVDAEVFADQLQETLAELAVRSLSAPAGSYRVGVMAPADVGKASGKPRRRSALGDAVAAHITSEGMHAAVMQVKVRRDNTPNGGLLFSPSRSAHLRSMVSLSAKPGAADPDAAPSDGQLGTSAIVPVAPQSVASPRSSGHAERNAVKGGVKLELHIWRADCMTGVLQLDRTGRVIGTTTMPVYGPGPMLGSDNLVGLDIADVLPPMRNRPLSDLFQPNLGATPAVSQDHAKKKGALKADKKASGVRERPSGAVNIIPATHLTDRLSLDLTVQAVWGWGPKKEIYVVVHIHEPRTGIANFREWLKAHPVTTKSASRRASQEHAPSLVLDSAADYNNSGSQRNSLEMALVAGGRFKVSSSRRASVDLVPGARSSATLGGGIDARLTLTTPNVTSKAQSSSRRNSVVIMAPDAAAPAMLDAGAIGSFRSQQLAAGQTLPFSEEALLPVDGLHHADDPEFARLDKALLELQQGASMSRSKAESMGRQSLSMNKSVGFCALQGDPSHPLGVPEDSDRTKTWVLSGGRSSDALSPEQDLVALGGKQPANLRNSSDGSINGPDGRSPERSTPKAIVVVHNNQAFEARHATDDNLGDPEDAAVLTKDALALVGDMHKRSSEDGSATGGSVDKGPAADQGDYRRGKRFKRLTRMLTGEAARKNLRRFQLQAWAAAVFVVVVTVACFVTMYSLMTAQQTGVMVLNTVGRTGVATGQIYMTLVNCDMLMMNEFVPGLTGLNNASDIQSKCLNNLLKYANQYTDLLSQSFYTVMGIDDDKSNLHAVWNQPTQNATLYDDSTDGISVIATSVLWSLWDIGNMYGNDALMMQQNILERNATVKDWRQWSYPMFIAGNSDVIFQGLYTTLDGLVQYCIDQADEVNKLQYTLMAVEGIVCSALVVCFMFIITTRMTVQRWNMYNVFMVIPITLLKSLARKTETLEDIDAEPAAANQEADGQLSGGDHVVKLNVGGASSVGGAGSGSGVHTLSRKLLGWLSMMAFWRTRASVSPIYTKRKLTRSHFTAMYLCLPFLAWGIMMVAINVSGHSKLAEVSGPIAIFNLVNFVTIQFYRTVALVEDMIQLQNMTEVMQLRTRLLASYTLPTDYAAMLYGGSAVPNLTSMHYTLATSGVAFSGGLGASILYQGKVCLRANQSTCLTPDQRLYPLTISGLDAMMQAFMRDMATINSLSPAILATNLQNTTQFADVWTLRSDIQGGLDQLNAAFYSYVTSVYSKVTVIHTIGLVMSIVLMVMFVLFMLRPYMKQVTSEARRIAELLSQLPSDVDVEGLVRRAQINSAMEVAKDEMGSSANSDSFPPAKGA